MTAAAVNELAREAYAVTPPPPRPRTDTDRDRAARRAVLRRNWRDTLEERA